MSEDIFETDTQAFNPDSATQPGSGADNPIVTATVSDQTNPGLHTTDPTPEDCRETPPRDDGSNLTGYYRRPPDERNHQQVITGDAEAAAIASRARNGLVFLGYKSEP